MKILEFSITTLSPLILSEIGGAANIVFTKDHIPGGILRGLFASEFLKKNPSLSEAHKNSHFHRFFLSGNLLFNTAYIGAPASGGTWLRNYPLPFSLQRHKDDENIIFDLLFDERPAPTKSVGGYGRLEPNGDTVQVSKTGVLKQLFFHHQRDPEKGIPAEGQFFNYESLKTGQTFIGDIRGDDAVVDEFYETFRDAGRLYIGRSKNSQYGEIRLSWLELPKRSSEIPVPSSGASGAISMTFLSDTIIYGPQGSPVCSKENIKTWLRTKTGIPSLSIGKAFLRTKEVENYVSVWKLRRPSEYCLAAGSCLLIELESSQNNSPVFSSLESEGIGKRREEGFGRVVFGLQKPSPKWAVLPTRVLPGSSAEKAVVLPPVSSRLSKIVQSHVLKLASQKAQDDAESFSLDSLSKSLISRLESVDEVHGAVQGVKKPAENALKDSHSRNLGKNLYEFLASEKTSEDRLSKIICSPALKSFLDTENAQLGNPLDGVEFKENFRRIYFEFFFSHLRKRLKLAKGK